MAGGIVSLLFYTLGANKTMWVFVGLCVLGVLIGIFEDIDFSSSNAERQANTDKLMAEYQKSKTGCIQGDCVNGEGVYVFEDKDRYEGFFKNSKFLFLIFMLFLSFLICSIAKAADNSDGKKL